MVTLLLLRIDEAMKGQMQREMEGQDMGVCWRRVLFSRVWCFSQRCKLILKVRKAEKAETSQESRWNNFLYNSQNIKAERGLKKNLIEFFSCLHFTDEETSKCVP